MKTETAGTTMALLEDWLSEEGILTGARRVEHIEFDCNWTDAFRVVLKEWVSEGEKEYIGSGPNKPGGLTHAILEALKLANGAVLHA